MGFFRVSSLPEQGQQWRPPLCGIMLSLGLAGVLTVAHADEVAQPTVAVEMVAKPDEIPQKAVPRKLEKHGYAVKIDAPQHLMSILKDNLSLYRWQHDMEMDDRQLRRLYRATPNEVRELLEMEGYYAPDVKTEFQGEEGSRTVVVHVDPGKPVKVATVNLRFEGDVVNQKPDRHSPGVDSLREKWKLPKGSRFRMADWETAKLAMLQELVKVRYPHAAIKHTQAVVDPESCEAHLTVELDSGREIHFGDLTIVGLRRYGERTILGLHPPKKGSVYNEERLKRFQTRLMDSGYFQYVTVTADVNDETGVAPITVEVNENYKKHASVGVGYSTDTRERVTLNYDNLHFLGQDWHLKSSAVIQHVQQTLKADVLLPESEDGFRDSFGAEFDRSEFRGLDSRTVALKGRRAWGSPRFEQYVQLEYLNEHDRIDEDGSDTAEAMPFTYGVIYRKLDNRIAPTEGYQFEAQVGGAVEGVLTDNSFARGYLKGKVYHRVGRSGDLIIRGEAGALLSDNKDGIPQAVLFRAGGDQSVRGYSYESLGVRRGDAVVGGRYLAAGSVEYQHYFWDDWGVAVFVDAGNVADKWADIDYAVGFGAGIRWKSPAGPLGVDLAYGEKTGNFHLHFSLGLTF